MDINQITECLADARCGLLLLAGLDPNNNADQGSILTIHAAQGAITRENEDFIKTTFAALDPGCEVRVYCHTPDVLYAPDSLERFSRLFDHEQIVLDPTGSFVRTSKLTKLARAIRAKFGYYIDRILWQAETSKLIVVAYTDETGETLSGRSVDMDWLTEQVGFLVKNLENKDLSKVITSIQVSGSAPSGKYVPVDIHSYSAPAPSSAPARKRGLANLLARVSGIAALIGLGAISAANAKAPIINEEGYSFLPGVTALVGLTTLGENSYGMRNRYQAIGGLRLYFGDTGTLMMSTFKTGEPCSVGCSDVDDSENSEPRLVLYGS